MLTKSLALVSAGCLVGIAAGWLLRSRLDDTSSISSEATPTATDCATKFPPRNGNATYVAPPARPEAREDAPSLQLALSNTQARLDACLAATEDSTWPTEIGDAYRLDTFSDKVDDALSAVNVEGNVEFHCETFPCVAVLPEGTPRDAFKHALQDAYGAGTKIRVLEHTAVGAWGSRVYAMATAVPESLDSERRDQADARCWAVLVELQNQLVSETREDERADES